MIEFACKKNLEAKPCDRSENTFQKATKMSQTKDKTSHEFIRFTNRCLQALGFSKQQMVAF